MKKNIWYIILMLLAATEAAMVIVPASHGKLDFLIVFLSGIILGMCFVALKLNVKNAKIDTYKRELEKESITADENSSKVKVLEQKIEVLEKALENALNNK